MKEEFEKMIRAGFIKEVAYSTWLSNIVMVNKSNGKWRMCVDYTNLNKACPKDAYPLPNIDQLVVGTYGYKILNFLDAYSVTIKSRCTHRMKVRPHSSSKMQIFAIMSCLSA